MLLLPLNIKFCFTLEFYSSRSYLTFVSDFEALNGSTARRLQRFESNRCRRFERKTFKKTFNVKRSEISTSNALRFRRRTTSDFYVERCRKFERKTFKKRSTSNALRFRRLRLGYFDIEGSEISELRIRTTLIGWIYRDKTNKQTSQQHKNRPPQNKSNKTKNQNNKTRYRKIKEYNYNVWLLYNLPL